MPWKITTHADCDKPFAVVKISDGSIAGCHNTEAGAKEQVAALYASEEAKSLEPGSILVQKDIATGRWKWLGVPTNNFRDREHEILTASAHRRFVNLFESKEYERITGQPAPELWLWHLPVPIGDTSMLAYDERGFLIAGGWGYEGEFYDKAFSGLASSPFPIGMSHGMPPWLVAYDRKDSSLIPEYLSVEFTALPLKWAANLITPWLAWKEKGMKIEPHQEEWFETTFGKEFMTEFSNRLDTAVRVAKSARLDQKGLNSMNDKPDSEQEEEEDKMPPEKKDADTPEFITAADLTGIVAEITKGISDGVAAALAPLKEQSEALATQVKAMEKKLAGFSRSNSDKLADLAENTPQLSLAASIAKSIVGNAEAELKKGERVGKRPRVEKKKEASLPAGSGTGIGSLDKMIARQQKAAMSVYQRNGAGYAPDFDEEDED